MVKLSLFIAIVTTLRCLMTSVSFAQSMFRGVAVFAGVYAILVLFSLAVRFVLLSQKKGGYRRG